MKELNVLRLPNASYICKISALLQKIPPLDISNIANAGFSLKLDESLLKNTNYELEDLLRETTTSWRQRVLAKLL